MLNILGAADRGWEERVQSSKTIFQNLLFKKKKKGLVFESPAHNRKVFLNKIARKLH